MKMATNFIQDGKQMLMPTATGAESGDAFVVGNYFPCVLLTDAGSDSPYNASVQTEGVFDLSVKGNDGGAQTVEVGDLLFWHTKDVALDLVNTGKPFGIALEAVGAGDTTTIKVLLTPKSTLPNTVEEADLATGAVSTRATANKAITSDKLADNTIKIATVSLDATDIKTLESVGADIVAAPGSTSVIEFVSAVLYYDYDGSNAYTAANGMVFSLEGESVSEGIAATFLEAAANQVAFVPALQDGFDGAAASHINKKLVLKEGVTDPTGSSTATDQLIVKVIYRIHDFA
jgi:predicted RecA/RadA family phage recombinase